MLIADDLPTLERNVERAKTKHAENVGAKKSTLKLLMKKYQVETVEEAEALHAKLLKKTHRMLDEAVENKKAFEDAYLDKLTGE